MNNTDKLIFRKFISTLIRFNIPIDSFEGHKWEAIAAAAWGTKNV